MNKKSIRFFNDREVRAVWNEEHNKCWFSATDIVRAINDEDDYVKAGNYWRWLKKKLDAEGVQLVSVTHDFKFLVIATIAAIETIAIIEAIETIAIIEAIEGVASIETIETIVLLFLLPSITSMTTIKKKNHEITHRPKAL